MLFELISDDITYLIKETKEIWTDFVNARIFITGGTGFIGYWLLESFVHANELFGLNAKMTVLSRNPDAFLSRFPHLKFESSLNWIKGDVRTFDFPNTSFTHIIHGATDASAQLNSENPLKMFDTIVSGTRRVLELARASKVKNMLLLSSGAVYGDQPTDMPKVKECYKGGPDICGPNSAYAEGKRAAEFMSAVYSNTYGFDIKIARCFAFVGPLLPLDTHFAVGNFIRDCLYGSNIIIKGDGLPYRSYQYVIDLIVWLWHIFARGKTSYPYNVGSDDAINIHGLAKTVASCFSHDIDIIVNNPRDEYHSYLPPRYVPSVDRAMSELNLKNKFSLIGGISRTIDWEKVKSKLKAQELKV